MQNNKIHIFDNNVKVWTSHLIDLQKKRYETNNLHEPEEEIIFIELLNKIPDNGVFVNIGSAIGYYPILAKLQKPSLQIYAFEPLGLHRRYFNENIKLNNLKKEDFKLSRYGISVAKGSANFNKSNYASKIQITNNKLNKFQTFIKLINGTSVRTITMKNLLNQVGGKVHLVQMDIQGHEKDVLYSSIDLLKENLIQNLLIGTHSKKLHAECKDILENCNYKITHDNYDTLIQPDGILVAQKIM